MLEALRGKHGTNKPELSSAGLPNEAETLSRSEKEALRKLDNVAQVVDRIYQLQKQTLPYPEEVTKEQLLEIGQQIPAVFSPTTVVERKNGNIVAVPYHERFKRESQQAATASRDAAKVIGDPATRKTLEALSVAFSEGKWSEFEVAWLTQDYPPNIDVFAGPFESHMDKLLGRKHVFEIAVGYIDRVATERTRRFVERALDVSGRDTESLPRVQVRVDNVLYLGGLLKGMGANAFTMPNDPNVGEQYGYKMVFLKENMERTFDRDIWPVIQTIFEEYLAKKYDYSALLEASRDWLSLHEASHPLVQQASKKDRFLEFYAPVDELHCDVSALNLANELEERSLIEPEDFERILMVHIANKFVDYGRYYLLGVEEKEAYARGSVVELNYLFEHARLMPNEHNQFGLTRENDIVESSKDLLGYLDILARNGRYSEVRNNLFQRYRSLATLRGFDESLRFALTKSEENSPQFKDSL